MEIDRVKQIKNNSIRLISISLISLLIGHGILKEKEILFKDKKYYDNKITITKEEKEKLSNLVEEKTGQDIDNDNLLIISAVINNPNLEEQEKNTIYKLIDILEDNPYLDRIVAYNNLKELDIIYSENDDDKEVTGIYNRVDNTIKIFDQDNKEDVLIHELIHSIFTTDNSYKLPDYLVEGVTELLVDEYASKNPYIELTSYPYQIAITKMLCDMVGSNKVLKAYTIGDMDIIIDELNKVMGEKETKEFLNSTDKIFKEYIKDKKVNIDTMSIFLEYANNYMLKKYPIENEVHDSYEYNKEMLILLKDENPDLEYINYVVDNGYYFKPYFSKKLKEKDTKYKLKKINKNPFKSI